MNPFQQQGNGFDQNILNGSSGEQGMEYMGDWAAQTSSTEQDPIVIDPAMEALSIRYKPTPQPGTCPLSGLHRQLVAGFHSSQHGLAPAPLQFPPLQGTPPVNIAPSLLFPGNMPGNYDAVPGLSYPHSAPSVMSSDPGHPYANPMPYMLGSHLAPPSAPSFDRGRSSEISQDPSAQAIKPRRSRARNSSRSGDSNTLQLPIFRNRRGSEPGKRPIPAASNGKRKRELLDGRIQCLHCTETFKMPADRERHVKVKHPEVAMLSTVWSCQNRMNQIPAGYERWIPLENCKSCQQRKRYNASHNAEEHLRRKHFYPRIPGSKPQNESERRGGKGGGKDPDVQYLKEYWIEKTDICHKSNCTCEYLHEDLPVPSTDRRRSSRSTRALNLDVDVEMDDDASEASWDANSSVSGGISPLVADSQEYHGSATSMPMWVPQQSSMLPPSSFGFPPTQPGSFSSASSFQPSSFPLMHGSRPSLANSQQNSGTSFGSDIYSSSQRMQQDDPEFSPDHGHYPDLF